MNMKTDILSRKNQVNTWDDNKDIQVLKKIVEEKNNSGDYIVEKKQCN